MYLFTNNIYFVRLRFQSDYNEIPAYVLIKTQTKTGEGEFVLYHTVQ